MSKFSLGTKFLIVYFASYVFIALFEIATKMLLNLEMSSKIDMKFLALIFALQYVFNVLGPKSR